MLLLFLLTAIQIFAGYAIGRYFLGVSDLVILLPASMGIGGFLHIWLLNITFRIFPPNIAAWLVTATLLLTGLMLWHRYHSSVPILVSSISRITALTLLAGWIVFSVAVFFANGARFYSDAQDHGARIALIAKDGIPMSGIMKSYRDPQSDHSYHYAENLAAAAIFRQTGIQNIALIADIRTTYHIAAVAGLSFGLMYTLIDKRQLFFPLLGSYLTLFTGPGTWMSLLYHVPLTEKLMLKLDFLDHAAYYADSYDFGIFTTPGHFFALPWELMVSQIDYIHSPNPSPFMMIFFLSALGTYHLKDTSPYYFFIGVGILTASSALFWETSTPMLAIGIGLYLLLRFICQPTQRIFANILYFSVPCIFLLLFQGGVITWVFFGEAPTVEAATQTANSDEEVALNEFKFRFPPTYQAGYTLGHYAGYTEVELFQPHDWGDYLFDWGFALNMIPLILVVALWRKNGFVLALVIGLLPSIVFPFLFFNILTPFNNYRIATGAFWVVGFFTAYGLFMIWQSPRRIFRILSLMMIVFALPILTLTSLINFRQYVYTYHTFNAVNRYIYFVDKLDYVVQADYFDRLPSKSSVYVPPATEIDLARGTIIFGTYGRRYSTDLYDAVYTLGDPASPEYKQWMSDLSSAEPLLALGYRYVYVDEEWWNGLSEVQQKSFLDTSELVQEWVSGSQIRRLYKL